jgi:hypothetical protein
VTAATVEQAVPVVPVDRVTVPVVTMVQCMVGGGNVTAVIVIPVVVVVAVRW